MPSAVSPSVSLSRRGPRCLGSDPRRTVLWVRGEHDVADRVALSGTLAQAARLDDADIVVDLSGVTFMDASTIGALVAARNDLRDLSRSLSVRLPSPRARRLLDLCGLARLIDEDPAPAEPPVATALGSWVDVPASDFAHLPVAAQPLVVNEVHPLEPTWVTVRRHLKPARSVQRFRAPT